MLFQVMVTKYMPNSFRPCVYVEVIEGDEVTTLAYVSASDQIVDYITTLLCEYATSGAIYVERAVITYHLRPPDFRRELGILLELEPHDIE